MQPLAWLLFVAIVVVLCFVVVRMGYRTLADSFRFLLWNDEDYQEAVEVGVEPQKRLIILNVINAKLAYESLSQSEQQKLDREVKTYCQSFNESGQAASDAEVAGLANDTELPEFLRFWPYVSVMMKLGREPIFDGEEWKTAMRAKPLWWFNITSDDVERVCRRFQEKHDLPEPIFSTYDVLPEGDE